jgi:hypothetical protein
MNDEYSEREEYQKCSRENRKRSDVGKIIE